MNKLIAKRTLAERREQDALKGKAVALETCASLRDHSNTFERSASLAESRLAAAIRKTAGAGERTAHALRTVSELSVKVHDLSSVLSAIADNMKRLQASSEWGETRVIELEGQLEAAELAVCELDRSLTLVTAQTGPKRGRPVGHRGR